MVNTEVCVLQMMPKNVGVIVLAMKILPKAWRLNRVNPQSALALRKSYVPWRHTHYTCTRRSITVQETKK